MGFWARGAARNFWDHLLISTTAQDNNFKFGTQLGVMEQRCQKQLLGPTLTGVWARGAPQNFWNLILISTTTTSNLVYNLGCGNMIQNYFYDQKQCGVGYRAPHKFAGAPQPTSTSILVLKVVFGMLFVEPKLCTKFGVGSFNSCKNNQEVPNFFLMLPKTTPRQIQS